MKNNLLYDLALAPNLEVEIPVGKRWSLNAEYKCPWWLNSKHDFCYQLLSGGVEGRCWLGNRQKRNRLTGHFIGLMLKVEFTISSGRETVIGAIITELRE